MQFNAGTRKFEGIEGGGEPGKFGFEKGSREDLWMDLTYLRLYNKFGGGESKKEKKESEGKISTLMNRVYDFMFWCDDKEIEFYPVSEPKSIIRTKKGNDTFDLTVTLHRLPIDEVQHRAELDLTIPLILGPMEPLSFDEDTGECTAWQIIVAPWMPDKEIENALMVKQKEEAIWAHFNPVEANMTKMGALDDISIVLDELDFLPPRERLGVHTMLI